MKIMRTILSHLFTAFVVYWASGIFIVKMTQVSNHSDWTFEQQFVVSITWPLQVMNAAYRDKSQD